MDIGQVGNNSVSACPFCDKLFVVKEAGRLADSIRRLTRMYDEHLEVSAECWTAKQMQPSLAEAMDALKPAFDEAEAKRQKREDNNPDNGKFGYWQVNGIRHEATTQASSAGEAIEKCADVVGSWEFAQARFLGVELPEVF